MAELFFKHFASIVLSLIAGLGLWHYVELGNKNDEQKLSILMAVFVGAMVEFICVQIINNHQLEKGLGAVKDEQSLISSKYDNLMRSLTERLAAGEAVSQWLPFLGTPLTKEKLREVWITLLTQVRSSYYATNYIRVDQIYKTDWAQAALLIQRAKKMSIPNFVTKKVFINNTDDEVPSLTSHIEDQRQSGIDLHYIPFCEIAREIDDNNIATIDFGVFDDKFVLLWFLTNREVTGGKLLTNEADIRKYKDLFFRLFEKAVEFNKDRIVLVGAMDPKTRSRINQWPRYAAPYEEMNYAIHSQDEGWLQTFGRESSSRSYGAYADGRLVGFSILVCKPNNEAEFFVAIRNCSPPRDMCSFR